jgi:hypothetical protein
VASRADQVTLKNGDRLTGMIVKSDAKTLLIKTEFAGGVECVGYHKCNCRHNRCIFLRIAKRLSAALRRPKQV